MDWNICLVSDCSISDSSDLNNTLLYGSKVVWLPPNHSADLFCIHLILALSDFLPKSGEVAHDKILDFKVKDIERAYRNLPGFSSEDASKVRDQFLSVQNNVAQIKELKQLSFDIRVPTEFITSTFTEWERLLHSIDSDTERARLAGIRSREVLSSIIQLELGDAHASIISDETYGIASPQGWDTHQAAQSLMIAMQHLLLPDVSHLSVEEVKRLREMRQ